MFDAFSLARRHQPSTTRSQEKSSQEKQEFKPTRASTSLKQVEPFATSTSSTRTPAAFVADRVIDCYAIPGRKEPLILHHYQAEALGPDDVEIEIEYCGVCHSDIALWNDDFKINERYPFAPGHELVGLVTAKGSEVKHLAVGQRVGAGWNRRSCLHCDQCRRGNDQLCAEIEPICAKNGKNGGFANFIRIASHWAIPVPESLAPELVAPLLDAGVTVYTPFEYYGVKPSSKIGLVGLGGLGHLFIQIGRAWGCEVNVFSTQQDKKQDAIRFGAHHFHTLNEIKQNEKLKGSLGFICVTAYADLDWAALMDLLEPEGILCILGFPPENISIPPGPLIMKQLKVVGCMNGSSKDVVNCLRFCERHGIVPQIELYSIHQVNEVFRKFEEGPFHYRAVLKMDF